MTDPNLREPGVVRKRGSEKALDVACKLCGHPVHLAACVVRLPWYWRFFLRREFCCCTAF